MSEGPGGKVIPHYLLVSQAAAAQPGALDNLNRILQSAIDESPLDPVTLTAVPVRSRQPKAVLAALRHAGVPALILVGETQNIPDPALGEPNGGEIVPHQPAPNEPTAHTFAPRSHDGEIIRH
jgi:hypothetical protein